MAFHFWREQETHDFHNDQALHDETATTPWPWYANLHGNAAAVVKNIPVRMKMGKEQYAKYIASDLDMDDFLSRAISKKMVSMLWNSLMHPPNTYRGNQFRYRTADGSNNSVLYPSLGKAGLPYAKTVPAQRALHGARPDPGDLFDLLLARKDDTQVSQSGISMMLLYHASIIIHDVFRTDDRDTNISKTSSYLDLAPLYGSDEATLKSVRQMRDGLLKPDTFAEKRLINQPPGVCIYLIMYNRYHNYCAQQLLDINEHGRFSLPPGCDGSETARRDPKWQKAFEMRDEHLFQTARLITCGMYINVAIHDYLRCLMGLHTLNTPWTLDPRKPLPESSSKKGLDRGEGNMVSVEFNVLYRFHSPISLRDTKWTEEAFVSLLRATGRVSDAKTPEAEEARKQGKVFTTQQVTNGELPVDKLRTWLYERKTAKDTTANDKYFPPGLDMVGATSRDDLYRFKRGPDGKFDDAQLAAEMCRAMEDPICNFGAQQIPKVFKPIEVMGILQARKWEIATLNEFREFFGMTRFKEFSEINSDPEIQKKLRDLYEDPDLVEFYPGLMCEGKGRNLDPGTPMPNGAQSSLWRAVFSDAVTLVRSDRFYTLDWNVGSLTAWGMKEVTSNPKINKGSVMHRVFQRAFPKCFDYNSIHMWEPFYTPSMNIKLAQEQGYLQFLNLDGLEDEKGVPYDFSKLDRRDFHKGQNFAKWCDRKLEARVVRRTLGKKFDSVWRGNEYVIREAAPKEVVDFKAIREEILGGPKSKDWINPAILVKTDIPDGPLRLIMTNKWTKWPIAFKQVASALPADWEQIFLDYFTGFAQDIRLREQRPFQQNGTGGSQSYQLDVIKDLAIPVITRFVADLIGFWSDIKTTDWPNRQYDENQIYHHIENCQNFEAYDSDPTKTWERRVAFQDSIKVLKELAEKGVAYNRRGWLEPVSRSYGYKGDGPHVVELRKIGVNMAQALLRRLGSDEVAAVMLHTALEAAQRFVVTFAEVVAWFIDPTTRQNWEVKKDDDQTKEWKQFKSLSWKDTVDASSKGRGTSGVAIAPKSSKYDQAITKQLEKYILECQRLSNPPEIPRIYKPANQSSKSTTVSCRVRDEGEPPKKKMKMADAEVKPGELILLKLHDAYHSETSGFDSPDEFKLRKLEDYIAYGPTVNVEDASKWDPPRFSRRATIIGLAGLVKHMAHLEKLRVAHDKSGRIKRVTTPAGLRRYATVKWDGLVASPTTWNLRYDGVGPNTFEGADNADQGHGQNMIWEYESLWSEADPLQEYEKSEKSDKNSRQKEIDEAVDKAVKKAVAEALANRDVKTNGHA